MTMPGGNGSGSQYSRDISTHKTDGAERTADDRVIDTYPRVPLPPYHPPTHAQQARAEANLKKNEAHQALKDAQILHAKATEAHNAVKSATKDAKTADRNAVTKETQAKIAQAKADQVKSPMAKIAAQEKATQKIQEAKDARAGAATAHHAVTSTLMKSIHAGEGARKADDKATQAAHAAKAAGDYASKIEKEGSKQENKDNGWKNVPAKPTTQNEPAKAAPDPFKLPADHLIYTNPAHADPNIHAVPTPTSIFTADHALTHLAPDHTNTHTVATAPSSHDPTTVHDTHS